MILPLFLCNLLGHIASDGVVALHIFNSHRSPSILITPFPSYEGKLFFPNIHSFIHSSKYTTHGCFATTAFLLFYNQIMEQRSIH